jgi:hypothetical protein
MGRRKERKIAHAERINPGMKPGAVANPNALSGTSFRWTTKYIDCDDWDYSFGAIDREMILTYIVPSLQEREVMTWSQIEQHADGGSHGIEINKIIRSAQKRLDALEIYVESLFSLRISGRRRIWGVRERNLFRVLWWDPEHDIWNG